MAKVQPELNIAQEGVQMRFTRGHAYSPSAHPEARQKIAARMSNPSLAHFPRAPRKSSPAINPKIIVAIEGTKLRVWYPPPLNSKGEGCGNQLRNFTSKSAAKLVFLSQCACQPGRCCQVEPTPTA